MTPQPFKTVLEESGMKVNEVAARAGVSPATVYNARKQKRLSIESMRALAYAFRLGINDIIWGRLPGASTKPIGPNNQQNKSETKQSVPERRCDVHHTFYPVTQGFCERCK